MISSGADSETFEALSRELLKNGKRVRFEARGASMSPRIRDGQIVEVTPVIVSKLRKGDIVLTKGSEGFLMHRLVVTNPDKNVFVTRGDCGLHDDAPVRGDQILGLVLSKETSLGRTIVRTKLTGFRAKIGDTLWRVASRVKAARTFLAAIAVLITLCATPLLRAQVAVDSATNYGVELKGTGTKTLTVAHTTANAGTNLLLLVGVSINITNAPATAVSGVTYNGTALTLLGAQNDAANTRRVEMWYQLAPSTGNHNVVVSVNIPVTQTVGVVAGAVTFTGVDQTVPLGPFLVATGAAGANSQLDVPSVVNGMVLDTLAIGGNQNVTVPGPQISEWNLATSGFFGSNDPPDVTATGTARAGAPGVPISETFSGNSNWALAAVSINPSAADIGVTTSVAGAVVLGQNTTYTITVKNSGPSSANAVTLKDTLSAGMTLASVTPSVGTCVAAANPVVCTLGTLAAGAAATVSVVETGSASGSYANTAVVSDSGTPPDSNTGNNTFVSVATVQTATCANVSQATVGNNLSGVINTYYPGTANVAAGATSIPVGAATGAGTAIAAGNLLLVIQMQDAGINDSNSVAYGNGSTGQGFTALVSAGEYEFVTAGGPVSGGAVPIVGAGLGGGLVFPYHSAASSANAGRSTYQVILVPQYTTASFSSATPPTALAWNGSTGGVLVLDTSSTLTLNGATVSVDGLGFRGGAGLQLNGNVGGSNVDYLYAAPATYTGVAKNGVDALKGEGIAGTPLWVESGGTYLKTNTDYPSGGAADGSSARGAPGNAGGGGTDGNPGGNDQNAGGGGGGNGGAGGFGGDSWNSNLSVGGEGGAIFPASINRVALGGGGGAGTRNNSDGDNQASAGAPGGGILIIRAYALSGAATLTANGLSAYNGTLNDAGGGGGAGGSIIVLSANGGEAGLTLRANGGRGGDAWDAQAYSVGNRHGPGGGGGGGAILVSGAPISLSVSGGTSGTTLNPGVTYGATAGTAGSAVTNASILQTSGTQSGSQCTPDVTLTKTHAGNFTRGLTASYTISVSNLGSAGSTTGIVLLNDTLPLGLTPTSASGVGWTCSVVSQTVSCTNATVLAGNSSYPLLTVTANVAQTAPSVVTNTALVSGGGEINLANDSATDVATIVSSADLSVTDAASPNPVAAGSNITYTQVVTNSGPSSADNAILVQAVPASTTFVSVSAPAGWRCQAPPVGGVGNIVCTGLNLSGGTAAGFTVVVKVNAGTANGTVISDTVTASSSAVDPNFANNTASAFTVVGTTALAEMTVTNSASPNPVIAGNNITYTQTATNVGSVTATNPSLSENTPANTTFVSISAPFGTSCITPPVGGTGAITCTGAAAPPGSSGTVQIVVKVNPGTASGTVISDTVTVNSSNQAFGPNSATATVVVATAAQADLALATVATPSTVIAGNNITYTQTISNNGPAAASSVTFTQAIPANTTSVSVSAPAGWSCTTAASVTCTNPSVAANVSADILVIFNVAPSVAVASIAATSSVSSSVTTDPALANNSTTVITPVVGKCDLTVSNKGVPSPVIAGNNIIYTQTVSNSGPSNCASATFSEATPANTAFVSVSAVTAGGGTWTCPNIAPVACTNPSVPPGSVGTITAVYKVNAGTAAGTLITDTVTAGSVTQDTYGNDNTASVIIAVAGATQADLSVTNGGSPNPVTAGQNITYSQTVANGGPVTATSITLTENLPANTTFVSLSGPAGWVCTGASPYTCTIASLAAGANANFTFVVKVNSNVASGSTITDTATVTGTTADPNAGNNSASASVLVANSADLSLTNGSSPIPVQAGNNITYTQLITNPGPSAASAAALVENTPPNTTFQLIAISAGWSCTTPAVGSAGAISCTNPTFSAGSASSTLVLKVTAGTAAGTAVNDTASVSSSTADPNLSNNTATAADVVALATQADLTVTNSASPGSVAAGGNVTYTQSVTNNGPAAATAGATFTQVTPPNTNFQSITPPAGWTCLPIPPVGGTGTITCTDASALAVNATATFTLILQVNANASSGTNIAETATAFAANLVPGLTTNTATATVVVGNAGTADLSIVKTATPSPNVGDGNLLTYTLVVTNNGPAAATNVTVTDVLPSAVLFQTANPGGVCSEAGGTVTCLVGTLANGASSTITILTIAQSPGLATNTASVVADQTDSNLNNNTSSQTETITAATVIKLQSFSARSGAAANGVAQTGLFWKTGGEAHNLGFNVYREQAGRRLRLNPSLIAGSALLMSGALPKHSGRTYAWIDSSPGSTSGLYWLEDVDINGTRTMHGPVTPEATTGSTANSANFAAARMFSQLNQAQTAPTANDFSHPVENGLKESEAAQNTIAIRRQKQFELAARSAVKIYVKHAGWYRVTQPELLRAGLDPNIDPSQLHLYAEAVEHAVEITGASAGPGGFGPQAALEFYGTGIDTPYSGTRVYFLTVEGTPGRRIQRLQPSQGSDQPAANFPATVELSQHTTYFAALLTPNGDNFFGAIVSPKPVDQALQIDHLDTGSAYPAAVEVLLQGVILGYPHDVAIALNGFSLGDLIFTGQDKGRFSVSLPPGLLKQGSNTVTLTAQNGDFDTSLIQAIRITYPHSYIADSGRLEFTGRAGEQLKVAGFATAQPDVLDVTNSAEPVALTPRIIADTASLPAHYTLELQVPWSNNNSGSGDRHTLLAVSADGVRAALAVRANRPSHWHRAQPGGEIVAVSPQEFAAALLPVLRAHQAQGRSSVIVPVEELYDEFTFGQHSPFAIREFLRIAGKVWQTPPRYLLLNGRASLDPRNYLGFGHLDFVPTKIIPTASLMTASDDWFSDFDDTGMPTLATGRFPVSTKDEVSLVAAKVAGYEAATDHGPWTSQALMVADVNDLENFSEDSLLVQAQLPSSIQVTDVFATMTSTIQAQQAILAAINAGQLLVNYAGHGSEDQWSGDDLFDNTAANSLNNGKALPVFFIMDCLNGFFQDVYDEALGVTLMLAPKGGAVAVLASSGLTQAAAQATLNVLVVQEAFGPTPKTLGEAILKAKAGVDDIGVRKTYNLLGDPAIRIKQPH